MTSKDQGMNVMVVDKEGNLILDQRFKTHEDSKSFEDMLYARRIGDAIVMAAYKESFKEFS